MRVFIDFRLFISSFLCSVALGFSLPDSWYERYKNFTQSARNENARKTKIRKFWYLLEYYCDYDYTCFFSENCSTKHCRCSKSGQACTDLFQCNAEVCKYTDPLMKKRSEEDKDIDESLWTLLSRLRTFNVFCSHIAWQNCFSSDDKFPSWRLFHG